MFKYLLREYKPDNVIAYADLAKFNGSVYKSLGFIKTEVTRPSYVWVRPNSGDVLSRYMTQKRKLIEKGYGTEDESEDDIMKSLGYLKIYDSGTYKFIYAGGSEN